MAWQQIDVDTWNRREQFEFYRTINPTSYAFTVDVDVTEAQRAVRANGWRSSVVHTWAIASAVNRHPEFRVGLDEHGTPGVWDELHPAITVLNPERETFAGVWLEWKPDLDEFHSSAVRRIDEYKNASTIFPQQDLPKNIFELSSIPWLGFTGFELQIAGMPEHLAPIFTLGRFRGTDGRTLMPVSMQVSHAVADGFHSARLVGDVQQQLDGLRRR